MMSDVPGVLFVDDEEDILAGIRSNLRRERRTYRLHYALGVDAAIDVLAAENIDLIVTDMRMPGKNGVALLRHAKEHHPTAVRYVLSGEAEERLVMQAVTVAHRWLNKPVSREELLEALSGAMHHRMLLSDPVVDQAVAGVDALASPPAIYTELLDVIADDRASMDDVARVVERDPAVAAKVLQWANSAFTWGATCSDIGSAIVRIGLSTVSQLVLLAGVFRIAGPADAVPGCSTEALHRHVEDVAARAHTLRPNNATARLAGLLSHVGLLVQATYMPERLEEGYARASEAGLTLVEAERQLHGTTHADIGAYLLAIWGLPSDLVLAVRAAHDAPDPSVDPADSIIEAVKTARVLAVTESDNSGMTAPYLGAFEPPEVAA